ncbi:NAD-dependent epimerase/dehydratase family protein [Paenibacillus eucommiae]|uniref:Nucleoside-diphosphate-sugar epimerase n=1 Tax=Paenibacillus eucommiae TaxID=1355755 RepID=A0ABS4J399_9BACL|nr:NAD(P)-dependent oxidoreductase [Paenibacillus eucommiae]MBP1994275.1 nucleoside-diphosphate-sugar epimerase [Paenibacillus eucommiae]
MKRVAVTGGNGILGSQVVDHLSKRGYVSVILDRNEGISGKHRHHDVHVKSVDLNDYAAVEQALEGCDALIHIAAIPDPAHHSPHVVFANNTVSTFHVLEAAAKHGIQKTVIASSESAYGFPWATKPLSPFFVPVDESHPLIPEDCYGISKAVNEVTAEGFHRRTGMQVVCLRLSSILNKAGYLYFQSCLAKPEELRRVLWSYVDIRDAAEACVLAVEREGLGCTALNIAADDTFNDRKSQELLRVYFPDVIDIRSPYIEYEAFYSNAKAKELLGWQPAHYWRDEVEKLGLGNKDAIDRPLP